jgi:branched-chain amino acid transport system substrate-binding protein
MTPRVLTLALAAAACGGGGGDDAPIGIGLVTPITGDLGVAGRNQQESALLAVAEINAAGGVLGRPLAVELRDDATSAAGAAAAYGQLLGYEVSAILGPIHSAGARAIGDQIRGGHTITISGGATSPDLAELDDGGFFFRTVPSDAVQAIVLAQRIVAAGHQRVCIVHRDDPYGVGLADALRTRLTALDVVGAPYDPDGDLQGAMVPCEPARTGPAGGVVFVTFEGDGRVILADAAVRGWSAASHGIYLVDGNRRPELFAALGDASAFEGATGTAPTGPDPSTGAGTRLRAFQDRFLARYGREAATNGENHYDSLYLAALAIEIAGVTDGDAIRDAVALTSEGDAIATGDWAALRAAVAQGGVDYQGASGEVDLDPVTGDPLPPYYVRLWTLSRGAIVDLEVVTVDAL